MVAYPTRSMHAITVGYPVSIRNDEILVILVDNGSIYNRVCIEPIETLERNHYSDLKAILVSYGARKPIVVNLDVKVLVNLLSKTPFHNVVTIKSIPLNPRGYLPDPSGGATIAYVQPIVHR
jgi:hypothetical protein